ncbi:hypothetical protein Tco_1424307 [Tanacetum coccineum]
MAPLPPRDQRHPWLRYEARSILVDFQDIEERLGRIYDRQVQRVHALDFTILNEEMREAIRERLRMEHTDAQRKITPYELEIVYLGHGLHTIEEIDFVGFRAYWAESTKEIVNKGNLSVYWIEISFDRDFLSTVPSYTLNRGPLRRLCHRLIAFSIARRSQAPKKVTFTDLFYVRSMYVRAAKVLYLLAQYLLRYASRRKRGDRMSGGQFFLRLARHFRLLTEDRLRGLTLVVYDLTMTEYRRAD